MRHQADQRWAQRANREAELVSNHEARCGSRCPDSVNICSEPGSVDRTGDQTVAMLIDERDPGQVEHARA